MTKIQRNVMIRKDRGNPVMQLRFKGMPKNQKDRGNAVLKTRMDDARAE